MKTAIVRARIEPRLKSEAERVLHRLGLTASDAIIMLFRQIRLRHKLPFAVEIPNEETRRAVAESTKGLRRFETVDEVLNDLE